MKTTFAVYTVFLFFLFTILSISSCGGDSDRLNLTFSKVEKCMDALPDSALKLLKTIPHPEKLHGESQARYALLMTQAMDKNYMKFSSDSLIALALNYYTVNQREPAMQAKAQFYYGRVMRELNKQEDALKYFLGAKTFYDKTKEYKMLALIAEEIGMVNRMLKLDDEALKKFRESLLLHKKIGDSVSVVKAYQNIARIYLFEAKWDSCSYYYNKALEIASQKSYKSEASVLHEMGILYRQKEDLLKAESYLLQSLDKEMNSNNLCRTYLSIGYLYLQMDNVAAARKYIERATNSSVLETKRDAYDCLYWLEKDQKKYLDALKYCEKADSIGTVLEKQNSQMMIVDLQKKYENEKLQKENLQMKIKNATIAWISVILLLFVAIIMCYFYYKNKTHKRRIAEIEWQISDNIEEIKRYQQEIDEIQETNAEVLEKNRMLEESNNAKVGELNGKIMLLTMQNKNLQKRLKDSGNEIEIGGRLESYIPAFRILLALKEGTLRGKLSMDDREKLFNLFDLLYWNYVSRLRMKCESLTIHDLEICCFVKFGLSHEDLSRIFATTPDSVTKAKGRLKSRLGISSKESLDTFLRDY